MTMVDDCMHRAQDLALSCVNGTMKEARVILRSTIEAAIADAVAGEREACATLTESRAGMRGPGVWVALTTAADAIRARKEPT